MFYEICFIGLLIYIIMILKRIECVIDTLNKKYDNASKVQLLIMESQLSLYTLVESVSAVLNTMIKLK